MASSSTPRATLRYGLDAPNVFLAFLLGGAAILAAGVAVLRWGDPLGMLRSIVGVLLVWFALWMLVTAILMLLSSAYGKLRLRDRVLDLVPLRGDETVLDVGCGRGLLLVGAAHRLPRGRAIGIDRWLRRDQWQNTPEAALANARAEGVEDRVEVLDADMRDLPFPDGSIDVVVSSLALHTLQRRSQRRRALQEMARVLAPGGRLAIIDIARTRECARVLRSSGLHAVHRSARSYLTYPTAHIVMATRPISADSARHPTPPAA